jgi:Kef-type K+ transport system membrane component KefB
VSAILQLLLELAILITAAKAAGYVAARLKQPAVLGQLLAGLALGPSLIDFHGGQLFTSEISHETVNQLAEVGVIFLMFVAGLEVDLGELMGTRRVAVLTGVLGVVAPLAMGAATGAVFGFAPTQSLFIGLILTATSVSISAQTLMEMGVLRSREGLALLGAAVVDDVLVIAVLSLFLAFGAGTGDGPANPMADLAAVFGRMALYFALAVAIGLLALPRLADLVQRLEISEGVLAYVLVAMLLYAWSAEAVGQLASITGAFLAGLMLGRTRHRREIERGMHTLSYAFFVPLFLVSIGLQADARSLGGAGLAFAGVLAVVAVASKVIGCGLGARLAGMRWPESLRIGVGMVSRGEVGLIVATVGLQRGLIDTAIFAAIVLVVLASTMATPLLLRWAFAGRRVRYVVEPAGSGD